MKRLCIMIYVLAVVGLALVGAQENQEDTPEQGDIPAGVDGVARLRNIDTSGWRITDVQGDGINVAGGARNQIYLAIGGRYYFDLSQVDSEQFPFEIHDRSGDIIFSQADPDGGLGRPGSDREISEDGITFTLTESLAESISRFRAATYPGMFGFIAVYDPDAVEEAEEEAEADEETEENGEDEQES